MKTLSHILLLSLSLLLLTVADTTQAQDRNSTVYPYGCVPDSSLREPWMDWSLVISSLLESWMNRAPVRCGNAYFRFASFDSLAYFRGVSFDSLAYFHGASFNSRADFRSASFDRLADFSEASFDSLADFSGASFNSLADFSHTEINDHITFLSADLLGFVDFRFARFDSAAVATFHRTNLGNSLLLGDSLSFTLPHFDFTRANLLPAGKKEIPADTVRNQKAKTITYPGAKIVLFGPVDQPFQGGHV